MEGAETEQALNGYASRERMRKSKTGLLITIPPPDHLGEEIIKSLLQFTLRCHQHVTFSQRREKPNQKLTEAAKEQGEGEGKNERFLQIKNLNICGQREKKNKGKEMQHQRKIKDNSDE